MKKIKNILLYFRKDGKKVAEQIELMKTLNNLSRKHKVRIHDSNELSSKVNLVISGGGDGTFLDAARIAFLQNVPVAGINIGHMGFLTEIDREELNIIENLFKGDFEVKTRMMIDISVIRDNVTVFNYTGLNEAVIHRQVCAEMLSFGIKYNEEELPAYKGDGVIIATPTGSTAYNLSCNGPIIYPTQNSLVINAIAPHALTHRPIVLPAEGVVKIFLKECCRGVLSCDGKNSFEIFENDIVCIKRSPGRLLVVSNPNKSFFDILEMKLHFGKRM